MKRFRIFSLVTVVLLVMCMSFTACGNSIPKYTVYIETNFKWTSSDDDFGGLNNNSYRVVGPLTTSEFNWLKTNNFSHYTTKQYKWTEDQIQSQLVRWGFSSSKANDATNRLTSYDHAMLGLRKGSQLYCILK